ncbi:Flp family type IVb pilin [Massilia sp. Leaf139]|uniref:Flp family type IVb pilin n=1 Tax=Massilia sp. Leaf139 TaxID=1736272 RepID=UPI0006F84F27|nr:Flp family type IVb pilin [Massilia sp. Leaf139]KQQ87566.1 hypothetical protein ASF77_15775 [Massilia sp. Leaf139]
MKTIFTAVQAFIADEDGVTAIEYGLIAALVGVGVAVAAKALGEGISDTFDNVVSRLSAAIGS